MTANLVLRGVTVFALGKPNAALTGCRATDLAAGRTPTGCRRWWRPRAAQAASFLIKKTGTTPAKSSRPTRRPVPTAA